MSELASTAGADDKFPVGPVTRGPGGAPIDLTAPGTKIWFTARRFYGGDPVVQKTYGVTVPDTAAGITVNDPTSTAKNMLTVTVDAADTQSILATVELVFDVWLREPGGRNSEIYRGSWQVRAPIAAIV